MAKDDKRCSECKHPKARREGDWTPCDEKCTHGGPVRVVNNGIPQVIEQLGGEYPKKAGQLARKARLTVHAGRRNVGRDGLCERCRGEKNREPSELAA